jgi:outer membrane receptor protein involved in Fe transport
MKMRKRTLLVPLLIAASTPMISPASAAEQTAQKVEDQSTVKADGKSAVADKSIQLAAADTTVAQSTTASKSPKETTAAQEVVGLQEITVTAERRTTGVQKTAAAISVRKGDDLLQQGKTSIRQILEDVPAVVVTENQGMFIGGSDTAGNNVTIRGIKSNSAIAGTPLPTVPTTALYTDGVYEGIGGSYDVDRVEILRGPQGTLYGRSATSGVVAAYTRNPTFDGVEAEATAELGSYSLQHYTGAVNVPVSDKLALRIAADQFSRDGYDSAEGGKIKRTSGRLKALFKPTSDLSILFGAAIEKNKTNTGGVASSLTGPDTFEYSLAPIRSGTNEFTQYWLNIDWNLGPATLTYLPAVRSWEQDAVIYQNGPGGGGLNQILKTPYDKFVTHELRLASNDKGPLKWIVGGFYYDNNVRTSNDIRWFSSSGLLNKSATEKETSNVGVFGEMTYALQDNLRLTGGLRYDYTHVRMTQDYTNNLAYACNTPIADGMSGCMPGPPDLPNAGLPENNLTLSLTGNDAARKFYNTTYKFRIEHDLSSTNLLYAMVSTGFIPGDVQVAAGAGGAPTASEYGAEKLTAYEIGSKNRFLNNQLQVNGGVFYYDYGGFRTSVRPDPRNPGSQILVSVPAKVVGAELETQYLLTPKDQISLGYSYTNAYFSKPPLEFTQYVAEKHDVPGAVPHSVNAAYRHTFQLPGDTTLDFRIDARYQSAHNLDNVSAQLGQEGLAYVRVGDQWTGNLSGTWMSSSGNYSLTAYVRNVANKRYKTFGQLQMMQPIVVASGTQSDPRTFGLVFTARY